MKFLLLLLMLCACTAEAPAKDKQARRHTVILPTGPVAHCSLVLRFHSDVRLDDCVQSGSGDGLNILPAATLRCSHGVCWNDN